METPLGESLGVPPEEVNRGEGRPTLDTSSTIAQAGVVG